MGINRKLQNGEEKGVIPGACTEGQLRNLYHRDGIPSIMSVANILFPIGIVVFPPQPLKVREF